jgi:hypothetical protein
MPDFLGDPAKKQAGAIGNYAAGLLGNPYQGLWSASPTSEEYLGIDRMSEAANALHFANPGKEMLQLGMDTASGKYLDLDNNQQFQDYLNFGVLDPINKTYAEELMPQLKGNAVGRNEFDNLRYAYQIAQMKEDQADMLQKAGSTATMGMFDRERDRQMMSPDLINAAIAQMMLPGTLTSSVGQQKKGLAQSEIDFNLGERYGPLTENERIIAALMPQMQTYAGQQTTSPGINRTASTAQGAVGGASMGAQAGGGGWGSIIGALLGGVAGGAGGYFG